MKKVMKIIGLIILIFIILVIILLVILSNKQAAPKNYQDKVSTGGDIEEKYLKNGSYQVSYHEDGTLQEFSKFEVYYPSELETSNSKYPVIVMVNGSGTPLSKYYTVAKHYASWGFIVIGTEQKYDWNGLAPELCIRYLERLNENEKIDDKVSIFYNKIDFDNVGIVGHSQGGVGVINALTTTEHKDIYKAAVSLSPTNKTLAHNLLWDYDATKINTPIMLISGEGGGDDWVVTGDQLTDIYNDIPGDKIKLRRKNTPHGEILYSEDGYVLAWFMYYLKNDNEAKKAFVGDNAEILTNTNYQDIEKTI